MPYLHIFGDSSVIINWERNESTLAMVNLEAWCINTRKLISLFTFVDFSHVFKEHNKRADTLSKEGLTMVVGLQREEGHAPYFEMVILMKWLVKLKTL